VRLSRSASEFEVLGNARLREEVEFFSKKAAPLAPNFREPQVRSGLLSEGLIFPDTIETTLSQRYQKDTERLHQQLQEAVGKLFMWRFPEYHARARKYLQRAWMLEDFEHGATLDVAVRSLFGVSCPLSRCPLARYQRSASARFDGPIWSG
jgi:hypothetical protein